MYAAKRAGGGRSCRYRAALRDDVLGANELADELGIALAAGAMDVEYQPIVTTSDGAAVAMEALVRWDHPTRGRLAPGAFLPAALERGLLSQLDLLVIDKALAAAATWRSRPGAEHVVVHVNASPSALARGDFVAHVATALAVHRLPGCALVVEITEQSLVEPGDRVEETLRSLRGMGVFIALDDFGTGYSSLSYLDRFDIDTLKLDRSFLVKGAAGDCPTPLLGAVLQLARSLGMAVVAEGVETLEQQAVLAGMSCPLAQGYLFSPSLDLEHAVEWLDRNHREDRVTRSGAA
jgi:EAL domain-containing protein (putative c-di-GMP-specific phosphodiesterase class I)